MAVFLLQKDDNTLEIEEVIIEELLKSNKYLHEYSTCTLKDIDKTTNDKMIPVGTIDFVTKYIRKFNYCNNEVPIEIPKYLQTEEFLKRDYKICKWDEIPRHGKFFLKDVSELKKYGNITDTTYMSIDDLFNYVPKGKFDSTLALSKEHMYQVSSLLPIQTCLLYTSPSPRD